MGYPESKFGWQILKWQKQILNLMQQNLSLHIEVHVLNFVLP